MHFTRNKKYGIYAVERISGAQDNILGVSFDESNSNKIEMFEYPVRKGSKIQTSKEEVLEQVLSGLEFINKSLGTNYKLSKIYFAPEDRASNSVYKVLICALIEHYHDGKEFKERLSLSYYVKNFKNT